MKRTILIISVLLALTLVFTSCRTTPAGNGQDTQDTPPAETADTSGGGTSALPDPSDPDAANTEDFAVAYTEGNVTSVGTTYTITSAGEYTFKGLLDEGNLIVDAGKDDDVRIILNGVSITSSSAAPISVVSAGSVTIKSEEGTYNTLTDNRAAFSEDSPDETDAVIYSACDLDITGKGTLIVTGNNNGIKTKDDLSVKNVTLKVTAAGNALKGNDSVTIKSGSLMLISTGGDGIKTSNSDVSSKGNQRGTVEIRGGQVDIYALHDGISAAYDVVISEEEACVVNIFTGSYASEAAAAASSSEIYLVLPVSLYSSSNDYYAYLYNDDDTAGTWVKYTYDTMIYNGRTASYYGLTASVPSGYSNILFNIVPSGTVPDGSNYTASTGGETINTSLNAYMITIVSGDSATGDWVQVSTSGGGSNKTTFSSKGIKAVNGIEISGGTVTVKATDDGLHANYGDTLDNGKKSSGSITVSGGSLSVTSADDGIHADGNLTISGGNVNVVKAHEGLEGNVITVSGGTVYVYGEDDGINASAGASTPLINITGGYLDVTTPSGDTDAVDANGNFTMSGGTVIIRGGANTGGVAGSVDVDGSITVTGGTIIALGGICETPGSGSVNTYVSDSVSFSSGTYSVQGADGSEILSFTLSSSYSSFWIASDAFVLNSSYSIVKDGTDVVSWTQSSQSEGSGGNSSGGFGGPGGFGGRR